MSTTTRTVRVTATDLPPESRRVYRTLRLNGFSRRDANLVVIGALCGAEVGTITTTSHPAPSSHREQP